MKATFILATLVSYFFLTTIQNKIANAMPVFDNEFACTTADKANQYVHDFNIEINSFGGTELCNGSVDSKKLFNDLQIIEQGNFSSEGQNLLVRNFVPITEYYSWLKTQTESITRGNDVPYATAYNSMGHFTMQDGWSLLSTLGRVGVVIHEARHTEGYRHITCKQGPYQGFSLPGCDSHYDYAGSHAVEMEYYARVVTMGQNFHPLYKKMARLMAMGRANFVFNQPVLQKREALFLIKNNNTDALLIDGQQSYPREVSASGILKRTSAGASIFNGTKAWGLDPYEIVGDLRATEDGYSYYKLLGIKKGLPNDYQIKDMEEFDDGVKRYVVSIDNQGRSTSYQFQDGKWATPTQASGFKPVSLKTRLWNQQTGLFLLNDKNEIVKYSTAKADMETTIVGTWPAQVVNYVVSPDTNETLQLTTAGDLLKIDGTPYNKTQGIKFSQGVNIPLYDAFTVKTSL